MLLGFYKLWPAAQLVNFYIIPLKFRVNFSNIVSLFWNTYVSWLANRPVHVHDDAPAPISPTGAHSSQSNNSK